MKRKSPADPAKNSPPKALSTVENHLEQKMEDLVTLLSPSGNGRSMIHADIMTMVERSLFRIALHRSDNIRSRAALYLGVNRNTFQKKLTKLGLDGDH